MNKMVAAQKFAQIKEMSFKWKNFYNNHSSSSDQPLNNLRIPLLVSFVLSLFTVDVFEYLIWWRGQESGSLSAHFVAFLFLSLGLTHEFYSGLATLNLSYCVPWAVLKSVEIFTILLVSVFQLGSGWFVEATIYGFVIFVLNALITFRIARASIKYFQGVDVEASGAKKGLADDDSPKTPILLMSRE